MSFMFNPHPYDDKTAINNICLDKSSDQSIICDVKKIAANIGKSIIEKLSYGKKPYILGIDGYISAEINPLANLIAQNIKSEGYTVKLISVLDIFKNSDDIELLLQPYLHVDQAKDPVSLFGKIYDGDFSIIFDEKKLNFLKDELERKNFAENVVVINGHGAAYSELRQFYDSLMYLDIIPKEAVLRFKNGIVRNLGDNKVRPYKEMLRRCYYFDFEIAERLRSEILNNSLEDYYLLDNSDELQMMPSSVFDEICSKLAKQPFRCKPVYNEGVWGGYYTISQRNLPDSMKNCAWVFDLIPLEVSVMVKIGEHLLDIPYFTFVRKEGISLMGKECVDAFGGYFPIRFNYDDTFHSNGNMSIQVHPGEPYIKDNFNEHGRQDESYYIVATGHDAKTYCGFNEELSEKEFFADIKKSEKEYTEVEYEKYVSCEPSVPGKQFLLPAGTIHASGRNQLILEIGSLTVGSYTFKLYDYLRLDLDGKPRPIHSYHGENVLRTERKGKWVKDNLIPGPVILDQTDNWKEILLGEHELIYFSLRRLEFDKYAEQYTNGKFHVLVFVDGEKAIVESIDEPDRNYTMNYLDMIVVPANLGRYRIRNLGNQPIVIHKTMLKEEFQNA